VPPSASGRPMARSTWEGSTEVAVQADPVESARPGQAAISESAETPGKLRLRLPGSRRSASPLSRTSGTRARTPARNRWRTAKGHVLGRNARCHPQADAQRCRNGAGTQRALLAAAVEQRRDARARAASNVKRADALRRVHLVA